MTPGAPASDSLLLEPITLRDLDGTDNLLQNGFWGEFKKSAGWNPRAFRWQSASCRGSFLVLVRRFPGNLRMAYIPYGPDLPDEMDNAPSEASALLTCIAESLKTHLHKSCFVIRFDLTGGTRGAVGTAESTIHPKSLAPPLKSAPYRVQPRDTVILNLDTDESGLLAGMHKKTRYNIRLAEKKGVAIHRYNGETALGKLSGWYELYRETGLRDGISLHSESYYRRLLEQAGKAVGAGPKISLYMAEHEGDTLAGIIVARTGDRSVYMYGASGEKKRELMPNQLLQWTAIRGARNEGAREYDFFGIPPADDPSHPMHGLWRFKTGFGGQILHYRGAWDYPCRPRIYQLYRRAEVIRGRIASLRKRRR